VIDKANQECLTIEIGISIPSTRLIRVLSRLTRQAKPNQNAFIERFNRTYPTEVLDAYLSVNLEQVQAITDQ
jgi:putative transposase